MNNNSIELPARLDQLCAFMEFAVSFASKHGFAGDMLRNIELCLEEALVNIFSYAYPDAPGNAGIECVFNHGELAIKVKDRGVPFDPLAIHSPDVHSNLATGRIGGYGIILIRKLATEVHYERSNDENVLTIAFRRQENS
ncbi:MAG: ATP-binding protein [Syntrophales bacterium]|jgi:anti-sigma regulatory factor (Ser/Thr protein kinase)|nr:ATP-binding protein [Syntrophales bacterium]